MLKKNAQPFADVGIFIVLNFYLLFFSFFLFFLSSTTTNSYRNKDKYLLKCVLLLVFVNYLLCGECWSLLSILNCSVLLLCLLFLLLFELRFVFDFTFNALSFICLLLPMLILLLFYILWYFDTLPFVHQWQRINSFCCYLLVELKRLRWIALNEPVEVILVLQKKKNIYIIK